jgi:uncharacterized protein (TIRG00374 family)
MRGGRRDGTAGKPYMLHYAARFTAIEIEQSRMADPATPADRRSLRPILIWAIKILVSGGLLYVLLTRVDLGRLWQVARTASIGWLAAALALYLGMVLISTWRWWLLLGAQHVPVPFGRLFNSYLVATFSNNFLPSNIGGDVVRIRDTAKPAGSKTLATTVVLLDRGLGLLGLVFVAALGATRAAHESAAIGPVGPGVLWGMLAIGLAVSTPAVLVPSGVGRLLAPLQRLHREWVSERIDRLTTALARFRAAPGVLGACFLGAVAVQAVNVAFYAAIAQALSIPIPIAHLGILVPLSFIVQMAPVSVNGFGVREATFSFYFAQLHLPLESALALSFIGAALIMVFSTSGAVAYLTRRRDA